ncbi:MAG: hypothetical protein QG656_722, partial [Candidatus Hydrogenedentes bacterium]|nr:hypothetical protein [Candidatus Hydrogenedentota bacterium]
MNIFTKAYLLQHVLRWRFTWDRRNTHYAYIVPGNPKFMSARDAVSTFIKDGDLVALSGLGAHQRPAIMYWAIRESFEETGHPRNLGFSTVAGMGGRGRMPGTLEELAIPELTSFLLSGHIDTFRRFLKIADSAGVTIQCLPQGVLALLVDAQMRGEDSLLLETGVGTFVDPRTGRGSPLTGVNAEQFVTVEGDRLRYRVPKAQVAIFNAPAVDREGNIYVKNAATICESYETAKAVKRNGGKVIANVGMVVEKGYSDVFLTADDLDAIVVNPKTEQTATILH